MPSPLFDALVGQPQAVELLTRAIAQDRIAPAYLFAGAAGVGRSLAARCFATVLLSPGDESPSIAAQTALYSRVQRGNHPDLHWVEPTYLHQGKRLSAAEAAEQGLKRKAPPEIRLEQVRDIARFLSRPPLEAQRSVIVLDQADSMAEAAANGLLKTLEEPGRATLILIAPSPEALLPTLVSRCQRIPFRRLESAAIAQVLTQTGHGDILRYPEILALAQGSPGEAIAHWQQLQAIDADLLQAVTQPPATPRIALDLARQIGQSLDTEAQLWLVDYLQHRYWQYCQSGSLASRPLASGPLEQLEQAKRYLLQYVQPRLVWEVTLMAICQWTR